MNNAIRLALFIVSALLAGGLLFSAFAELPGFGRYSGPYGDLIMQSVLDLRRTPQGVAAVTFDFRGMDTLGEEFILFAAVAGTLLLMRSQREEREQTPRQAAERFTDGAGYRGLVLRSTLQTSVAAKPGVAQGIEMGIVGAVLAVMVAATALYSSRLPGRILHIVQVIAAPLLRFFRGIHSGYIGDYVTWFVLGTALFLLAAVRFQ